MKSERTDISRSKEYPPYCFARDCGLFRLTLTKYGGSHKWVANCLGVFVDRHMASELLSEAQCQASALLQSILQEAIRDITGE